MEGRTSSLILLKYVFAFSLIYDLKKKVNAWDKQTLAVCFEQRPQWSDRHLCSSHCLMLNARSSQAASSV